MEKGFLSPEEISKGFVEVGKKKATLGVYKLFILGVLAGAFIAFAAEGSNVAIHTIDSVGIAKTVAGAIFAAGLMMVIVAGAELFTGNNLIVIACAQKSTSWSGLLKNWTVVYLGNFVGSMLIVLFVYLSGQLNFSAGMLGGLTIKIAVYKTNLSFANAFFLGILCNWLVCIAVWMSFAAKDIAGKLIAIFFPIWLFVTSGFEHSVANMYYIPAGILARLNPAWVESAKAMGVLPEKIEKLNWGAMVVKNLVPVTLGNIVGGAVFVGIIYWLIYLYKGSKRVKAAKAVNETKISV